MPELPEVESIRRGLLPFIVGRDVTGTTITNTDVVHPPKATPGPGPTPINLGRITAICRHGKQLAIVGRTCVCIHLGMTGTLRLDPPPDRHNHVTWHLNDGHHLVFRDPRRFGGIWAYQNFNALRHARWQQLAPDALTMQPRQLHHALTKTKRALKTALLDQHIIAGLGNIYVDETLFAARQNPFRPAGDLTLTEIQTLIRHTRRILNQSIRAGGTTLRDYVDAQGRQGQFKAKHRVYSRSGQPCTVCSLPLTRTTLGGRTTVYCTNCQPGTRGVPGYRGIGGTPIKTIK